jgi:hypothetical protein
MILVVQSALTGTASWDDHNIAKFLEALGNADSERWKDLSNTMPRSLFHFEYFFQHKQ